MKKRNLICAEAAFIVCLFTAGCEKPEDEGDPVLGKLGGVNFAVPAVPQGFKNDISADELAADIKIGWNLGNTLDAYPNGETSWDNPLTTKEMITAIKEAGFNTIRIPVSWHQTADSHYNISESRIMRVVEIVNYAAENDLYIILNTHHDEQIFKFMDKDMEESKKAFSKIWGQISHVFKNYNEKLIFEGLNEPRTIKSPMEWNGGTAEEHNNLNAMYQLFTDTVRASGGNNGKRVLMIATYAASAAQSAMDALKIPDDPDNSVNKFIVSIHSYSPHNFTGTENKTYNIWDKNSNADTFDITDWIDRAYAKFTANGYPVIGGEFGAVDKGNEQARAEWAEFYVSYAKSRDIKCIWWDDGGWFRLFNRNTGQFYFPLIHEALMRGVR